MYFTKWLSKTRDVFVLWGFYKHTYCQLQCEVQGKVPSQWDIAFLCWRSWRLLRLCVHLFFLFPWDSVTKIDQWLKDVLQAVPKNMPVFQSYNTSAPSDLGVVLGIGKVSPHEWECRWAASFRLTSRVYFPLVPLATYVMRLQVSITWTSYSQLRQSVVRISM
jgi:hypothetical protein